jgi:hypothetical protein
MRKQTFTPLLVVMLAACAASVDYPRAASADDRWGVAVSFPVFESMDTCEDDPSVESAVMSADMPASHLAVRLNRGSSEADAMRVAECVDQKLSGGDITIFSRLENERVS